MKPNLSYAERKKRRGLPPSRLGKGLSLGGVRCPVCNGPTAVYDSRPSRGSVMRHRGCRDCGERFLTWEVAGANPDNCLASLAAASGELRELARRLDILSQRSASEEIDEAAE